jgi:hypothetical protein
MNRIIKYAEPVPFHKAMPGARKLVIWKRIDDGSTASTVKHAASVARQPKNIPNVAKRENNMTYDYDTSRGPWHAMLDRMARARQAITGESYAKAFARQMDNLA